MRTNISSDENAFCNCIDAVGADQENEKTSKIQLEYDKSDMNSVNRARVRITRCLFLISYDNAYLSGALFVNLVHLYFCTVG